jgi:hypothetical protein
LYHEACQTFPAGIFRNAKPDGRNIFAKESLHAPASWKLQFGRSGIGADPGYRLFSIWRQIAPFFGGGDGMIGQSSDSSPKKFNATFFVALAALFALFAAMSEIALRQIGH